MLEKLEKCPICKNDTLNKEVACKDHFLTSEIFTLTRCTSCSFLFTNPRPRKDQLPKYYQSDKYISHSNKSNNLINTVYKIARYITLSNKVKLINSITTQKSILDYGCGTGNFLLACKKNGWKISGLEPDETARNISAQLTTENISADIDEITSNEKIDLISLWHVLEHIADLDTTISKLIDLLKSNGKLLIAVPNHESYDAQFYQEYWAAYDVPRHLYHFSQKTMKLFLNNHGLKIYNIIPMKLDAYYVSLLSEKYKYKKSKYVKSFINGYISNNYAKSNNNNYSSIIYIAGK